MKIRFQPSQILALVGVIIVVATAVTGNENKASEILVRRFSNSNSSGGIVPKILKLTPNGHGEVVQVPEMEEPLFTLKSDPVKVQSDFKTVNINVLHRQRDQENAKKVAIIQQDLQSRIKINETAPKTEEPVLEVTEPVTEPDPDELRKKQARVKEDMESRILQEDGLLGYRQEGDTDERFHYQVKRSDDDYYSEEPMRDISKRTQMTTEPPKEEDSFFSIFESLFGPDDDSEKKKAKPDEKPMFKEPEDIEENIKTVGDILKPLKPVDEPEPKTQNSFIGYQGAAPEYRIVNNFHSSQSHKKGYKPPDNNKPYHSFYRPTEKPFRPYRPHSTNGYEDYDLEEFMDKDDRTTARVKHTFPPSTTTVRNEPNTTTTTTTIKTITRNSYDNGNKVKFPGVQKKNDYINRNRYQEVKNEVTEKRPEWITERTTNYHKPEIKTTTTESHHHYSRPSYETKVSEVKPQKIQESPNFYNLINLPVRYSTKDTAIPLISGSYANTKIQGMGAYKQEKGNNGKYANHKYDQITTTSTTKRPNYWPIKRANTDMTSSSFRPSPMITKTTTKYIPTTEKEYENVEDGSGTEFGGYGSKKKLGVPVKQLSTLSKETTTRKTDDTESEEATPQQTHISRPDLEEDSIKGSEKPTVTTEKADYEDYLYDTFPVQIQQAKPVSTNQKFSSKVSHYNKQQQIQGSESENKNQYVGYKTTSIIPMTELPEYEYYDYEDLSTTTTTTTTTTPRYKIKYPGLHKDKIKASTGEKVAVVVPSKEHNFYDDESTRTFITSPSTTTTTTSTTTTTTTTTTPKPPSTMPTIGKATEPEVLTFNRPTNQRYKPYPQPAPVFEDVEEEEETYTTMRVVTEKPTTTTTATMMSVKPHIVTSSIKDQDTNVNILLVPTKETIKNVLAEEKYSQPEPPPLIQSHAPHSRPNGPFQPGFDQATEFKIGVVQGNVASPVHGTSHGSGSSSQGYYVASSIPTNPYRDDEPFRPIPKPPGFPPVYEEVKRPNPNNPPVFQQNKRPIPTPPSLEETEPIHEPHEFIPSPQFHRPVDPKPTEVRPGGDIDYDFEGIQTQPKPGQYVIFSKPQLNPEMNENQLKKKPEVNGTMKPETIVPYYKEKVKTIAHEKVQSFLQESQKHVVFNPKDGQFYELKPGTAKQKPTEIKSAEHNKPIYGSVKNVPDEGLSLQLAPPRGGTQTEKPFEGNFVVPEIERQETTVSYPRPHWEKNGKPSFLLNSPPSNNDLYGNRLPPQMAPTLIPPSSIPPQRFTQFRRPIPPHMIPMRKNFNEASTNIKPKPNLPNILPQFRPNAKVGSGPYQRPPGFPNRRPGMNRYRDKEHGNFPYHIQNPEKDFMLREYEMGPEIVPKFITNRGKIPSEVWNSQGMQKRFGQGPMNINSRSEHFIDTEQPGNEKILKRLQRTPVTTLQMLKQMPGVQTQRTQMKREDANPNAPLVPPTYKTYVDQPTTEENVYVVFPAKAPQKLQSDNQKVFIVSDAKSQSNRYNYTTVEEQFPFLNPKRRINLNEKPKPDFPYGFIKPDERLKFLSKQQKEEEDTKKSAENGKEPQQQQEFGTPTSIPIKKVEKIDMNLHMQSNNQWNEVRKSSESTSVRTPEKAQDHYRHSGYTQVKQEKGEIRLNPPSEYQTSIKNVNSSAFTLGTVMRTTAETSRKGQVASVSLHEDEKEVNAPKLKVNERIANGKIVTVSMPLDVKEELEDESKSDEYQFQAPFQASSSISSSKSHSVNSGWSIVKTTDDKSDDKGENETTESSTPGKFNFENFKPILLGGFEPIFIPPEEPLGFKEKVKTIKKEEKSDGSR